MNIITMNLVCLTAIWEKGNFFKDLMYVEYMDMLAQPRGLKP